MSGNGVFIGGYRVIRQLGAGGMGEVYLVAHPRLPRHDALKLLNPAVSRDEQFRSRFNREADLLARLRHPNIITAYDRGEHDGRLWLAMEYIDGEDASKFLRANGSLPPEVIIEIIAGSGAALDYAYSEHRVTHRDVKPANILLEFGPSGQIKTVKLADFGIAKAAGESTSLTGTGVAIGTMAYISPEAIEGRTLDNRSDVYSLGATAFELLTGTPPFVADTLPALMMAHLSRPVPSITARDPRLPARFDAVFARVLAKDPDARFATCQEFVLALRHAASAANQSTPAHSGTTRDARTWPGTAQPTPRLGTMGWAQHPAPPGVPYPSHAAPAGWQPPRRHARRRLALAAGAVVAIVVAAVTAMMVIGGPSKHPPAALLGASPVDIDRLLLGAAEINKVMGRDDMVIIARSDRVASRDEEKQVEITPAKCRYAGLIDRDTLTSDDVRQLRSIVTDSPTDGTRNAVTQNAIEAVSESHAREIFDRQVERWRGCVDQDLSWAESGDRNYTARYSDFTLGTDAVSIVRSIRELPQGHSCGIVLARKLSYLFDVSVCDYGVADQPASIIHQLLSRVTSAAQAEIAPPLPVLDDRFLDAGQVSSLVGHEMGEAVVENRLNAPPGSQTAISPAACTTVALPGDAAAYSGAAWRVAANKLMKPTHPVPGHPVYVNQNIVMTPSPDAATRLLSKFTDQWNQCLHQTYRFGNSGLTGFEVIEVDTPTPNMVVVRAVQTDARYFQRLRSIAVRGPYLIEVLVGGDTQTDMRAFTERLLDRLPE